MEAELEAEDLILKEEVFFSNMMVELGFNDSFGSVLCISTARQGRTPPATVPTVLAQSSSH